MSEITTGAVALSLIGSPAVVGAACVVAAGIAIKYGVEKYEDMLEDIQQSEKRLQWLGNQQISSPLQVAAEVKKMERIVSNNSAFISATKALNNSQKKTLAMAIVAEKSPIKSIVPSYIEQMENGKMSFDDGLQKSINDLAYNNLKFVSNTLLDAALVVGFNSGITVIQSSSNLMDVVFTDSKKRRLSTYLKLNKDLNPSLAIDLEGFNSNTNECSLKMNELIKYLNDHGIPFNPKRMKHNQPSGVLRKIVAKKAKVHTAQEKAALNQYLTSTSSFEDQLTINN